jgi:protein-tyrosine phosphatase
VAEAGQAAITVVFVCLGNICRSPIAERVAERAAREAGLTGVRFLSAATSDYELGAAMDRRAAAVLQAGGYRAEGHVARQVTAADIADADLVVAMEDVHVTAMIGLSPEADNLVLLTDFDPAAEPGSGVPDPWFGSDAGFSDTLGAVEAAMPGLLERIRQLQS